MTLAKTHRCCYTQGFENRVMSNTSTISTTTDNDVAVVIAVINNDDDDDTSGCDRYGRHDIIGEPIS